MNCLTTKRSSRGSEAGVGMIEVMVTLLIVAIGLLGMAGLQSRAQGSQMEAYQRVQAVVLAQDMVDRIKANAYVTSAVNTAANYAWPISVGTGHSVWNCAGLLSPVLDYCEWNNELLGAAETDATTKNVGAMIGARGCVTYSAGPPVQLVVTVVWQGLNPTVAPSVACGANLYGDDKLRRAISIPITIPDLID